VLDLLGLERSHKEKGKRNITDKGLGHAGKEHRRLRLLLFLSIQMSIIARHLEEDPRSQIKRKEIETLTLPLDREDESEKNRIRGREKERETATITDLHSPDHTEKGTAAKPFDGDAFTAWGTRDRRRDQQQRQIEAHLLRSTVRSGSRRPLYLVAQRLCR
jgi:hypothetical protein